ncbi:DUF5710 domain-containing protein [Burkholderia sp. LMG 13014]|uniref:DUF5710 domain-containing protein n=1 Tax=Burkholderia sp. LMG 13014 TaxID=2709306 RepID=UPI0019630588|nr:DUF5710 domain-containing protein [Burkholderia sp. LMG 13014]
MEWNRQEEYRRQVVRVVTDLIRQQQAPWQRPDRADLPAPRAPFFGVSEGRTFRGANALWLAVCASRRGWDDPRFVTAEQAESNGWEIGGEKGVHLQFWTRDTGGDRYSLIFRLFNASNVKGMPTLDLLQARASGELIDRLVEGTAPMVASAASKGTGAAVRAAASWVASGGARTLAPSDDALQALRMDLATFLYAREMGMHFSPQGHARSMLPLTGQLLINPENWFHVARDAQQLASELVAMSLGQNLAQAADMPPLAQTPVEAAAQGGAAPTVGVASTAAADSAAATAPAPVRPARTGTPAPANGKKASGSAEPGSRIFLAVPFEDRREAARLGARRDSEDRKLWWVSADRDLAPFSKWRVSSAKVFNLDDVCAEFESEMRAYGLIPPGDVRDRLIHGEVRGGKLCKWLYMPTEQSKGKRKNGACILDLDGTPHGYIKNFVSGREGAWRYDGAKLSPEQHAALAAQSREQAMLREREIAQEYAEVASRTQAAWDALKPARAEQLPYCVRKGVDAHGVRLARGEDLAGLLNMPDRDFTNTKDIYTVVPGRDVDGTLWTVQAIPGKSGGLKLFARDGRKKGAFHLIGAETLEEAASAPGVLFSEGYATGADLHLASGWPMVVAFDAGNLVEVARQVCERLPATQPKIFCSDNDQFFVEKALDAISDLVDSTSLKATNGQFLKVASGNAGSTREIDLGAVRADGQWHAGKGGKYRLELRERNGCVEGVNVSIVRDKEPDKMIPMALRNTGFEAAQKAAQFAGEAGRVIVPEFTDLSSRPTDFNDLAVAEGRARVTELLELQMGVRLAPVRADLPAERRASTPDVSHRAPVRQVAGISR